MSLQSCGTGTTHRIELTSLNQLDPDLNKWLRAAYDLDQ